MPNKLALDYLNDKQRLFLTTYLSNGENAPAAYAAVLGLPVEKLSHGQHNTAYHYLHKPRIKHNLELARNKIAARTEKILEKYAASKERVIEELAKLAFTNATDVQEWDESGVRTKPSSELSEAAKSSVVEVVETETKTGKTVKVKLADKHAALVSLGKTLGLFTEKVDHNHKHLSVNFVIEND